MRTTISRLWELALLATAIAQSISPSYGSQDLYPVATSPRFLLRGDEFPDNTPAIHLAPLGDYAEMSRAEFTATNVSGRVITITPENVNDDFGQDPRKFFYVSCDVSYYTGRSRASEVFNLAANNDDAFIIILFSTQANHCVASGLENLPELASIMTTTEPMVAELLLDLDLGVNSSGTVTLLPDLNAYTNDTDSGNRSWYQNRGPNGSPTTAVAMIILYSITGVITALFVTIIITGAIRAHRHPERYGPRAAVVGGRGRQGRARGIARAVVDSLPIVKFGDRDGDSGAGGAAQKTASVSIQSANDTPTPNETTRNTDIEMTAGLPKPADGSNDDNTTPPSTDPTSKTTATAAVAPVAAAAAAAAATSPSNTAATTKPTDEEAPSCSICTEEFTIGSDLRVLPCDHRFHPECVDPWLLNVSGTCPLCRIDLRPKEGEETATTTEETGAEGGAATNPSAVAPENLGDRQYTYPDAPVGRAGSGSVSQAGGFRPGEDHILAFSLRSGRSRGASNANNNNNSGGGASGRRMSSAAAAPVEHAGALATLRRAMAGSREERVAALRRFREETQARDGEGEGEGAEAGSVSHGGPVEEESRRRGLARRLRERLRVRTERRGVGGSGGAGEVEAGEATLGQIRSREHVDGRPV